MRIEDEVRGFRRRVEEALREIKNPYLSYALLPPGKLIRPLVVFAGAYPLASEEVVYASMAVELLHASSLVHDDLPAVDNDKFRRGKPAAHVKFGEGVAIMLGDALLCLAFEYAAELGMEAVKVLAKAGGMDGVAGGQILDLQGAENLEQIREIHLRKTAKLMEASFLLGLLVSGRRELMGKGALLGRELGLLFQVVDDILDSETCGGEPNVVKILGMEKSKALALEHLKKIEEKAEEFPGRKIVRWLAEKTVERIFSAG